MKYKTTKIPPDPPKLTRYKPSLILYIISHLDHVLQFFKMYTLCLILFLSMTASTKEWKPGISQLEIPKIVCVF